MAKSVLITGGAGFIGSFLADALIAKGHDVTIFDNLEPQVHLGKVPDYMNKNATFIKADIRDYDSIKKHITDKDMVVNFASRVGVAQSMYEIREFVHSNELGTANMMHALANEEHDVKKVLVASSMSIYGEGSYRCEKCSLIVEDAERIDAHLMDKVFNPLCKSCGNLLMPIPTKETKKAECSGIYAISKKNQEDITMSIGKAYGIPSVALRFFNTYGPRQSLSNPYTGVAAIFLSRLKKRQTPLIFEDGRQSRDFVSVQDIVQGCMLSLEQSSADSHVFNVGTGIPTSIKEIAKRLATELDLDVEPVINNETRKGDIRHCFADISKIRSRLGYEPKVSIEEGLKELVEWSRNIESKDMTQQAYEELKKKGLLQRAN
jgi:dTDP-L-rhamnose 4-epimerase